MQVAHNLPELFSHLGDFPFTFIAKAGQGETALAILTRTAPLIGQCNVVQATDSVFVELSLDSSSFALFRLSDHAIVSVEGASQPLLRASIAYYSRLVPHSIESGDLFAAYFDEEYNESIHSRMFDLAARHASFHFGVLERENFAVLNHVNLTLEKVPDFLVFSHSERYYFPSQELSGVPITSDEWEIRAEEYLKRIEKTEIDPLYVCEEMSVSEGNVTKLIGTNYNAFVDDPTHDVVVLYRRFPEDNETELELFKTVADEVIAGGTTSLRFGYINFGLNAPRGKLYPPFVHIPHLEVFPTTNKSLLAPMFGFFTKDGIMRFLKQYSSLPNQIDPEPITILEALNEHQALRSRVSGWPPDLAKIAVAYNAMLQGVLDGSARPTPKPTKDPEGKEL
jgi:hypothetical protein